MEWSPPPPRRQANNFCTFNCDRLSPELGWFQDVVGILVVVAENVAASALGGKSAMLSVWLHRRHSLEVLAESQKVALLEVERPTIHRQQA